MCVVSTLKFYYHRIGISYKASRASLCPFDSTNCGIPKWQVFLSSFVSKLFLINGWIYFLRDKSMIDWWRFFLFYSFAGSFSEKATRTIRRFSPPLAAKMRPPLAYVSFLLPSSPFLPLSYHPSLFIGLSSVDAHQLREQSISVANPVGSLSWYPHLVCASIYLLFHYATLWNMIWIPFFCLFHSEFCTLVYFMWFVHRLFGTTHWASWYAIYTNFLNLICHILLPCLIPRFLFSFLLLFVLQLRFFMQPWEHPTWRHVLTPSGRNFEQCGVTTVRSRVI